MTRPRIVIIYDWLDTRRGGAENVLLALHEAFPEADLVSAHHIATQTPWLEKWSALTTWIQLLPEWIRRRRSVMLLSPIAFEMLSLDAYDVVISVTSATAKGVLTKPHQLHITYLLTPPRYLYSHRDVYSSTLVRWITQPIYHYLEKWDHIAAQRPDVTIPISNLVRRRAALLYDQPQAEPIYPPVQLLEDTKTAAKKELPLPNQPFFIMVSRLVDYKRIDVAIEACQSAGYHLVIIGQGSAYTHLYQIADPRWIHWFGDQDSQHVRYMMQQAQALLMPGLEDFGITALEAASVGTPSILHAGSGVTELLDDTVSVHLDDETVESMKRALQSFDRTRFSAKKLKQIATKYATTSFVRHWQRTVRQLWSEHTLATKGHS